jgi:hypothetical protein
MSIDIVRGGMGCWRHLLNIVVFGVACATTCGWCQSQEQPPSGAYSPFSGPPWYGPWTAEPLQLPPLPQENTRSNRLYLPVTISRPAVDDVSTRWERPLLRATETSFPAEGPARLADPPKSAGRAIKPIRELPRKDSTIFLGPPADPTRDPGGEEQARPDFIPNRRRPLAW